MILEHVYKWARQLVWNNVKNGSSFCKTITELDMFRVDRKSTRLNSSHANISYAVFCLKKKTKTEKNKKKKEKKRN